RTQVVAQLTVVACSNSIPRDLIIGLARLSIVPVACCDCSQPLFALLRPRKITLLSPQVGPKRTLSGRCLMDTGVPALSLTVTERPGPAELRALNGVRPPLE